MVRIGSRSASASPVVGAGDDGAPEVAPPAGIMGITSAARASLGSLSDLPVAGLTRRRIGIVLASIMAAWVLLLFARQVGEAGEATAKAAAMRDVNGGLTAESQALEQELALIQRQAFIVQAAREYRLGTAREIPFQLEENAPALPDDAPGSASVRLGADTQRQAPLDAWLELLLGTGAHAGN